MWKSTTTQQQAITLLKQLTGNHSAVFHQDQWESIRDLVDHQRQMLVVQRTGWGKSAVYFIATKLRREQGFGPTIIISPLLSLIRNQIDSAAKLGLKVVSYNSAMSQDDRRQAESIIRRQQADGIIIAPEQLANDYFQENVLSHIINDIGLFVVDEAHCISAWGHDFRPDYGRIVRVMQSMPSNMPVLATTATANDRVVKDIEQQLGNRLGVIRGPLTRKALQLQNLALHKRSERMAWIAEHIKTLPGTGIIYAKTVRDAEVLAGFLRSLGHDVDAYHGQLNSDTRQSLEIKLINNNLKALVATSALGMGFDKPDIGFVIHFQAPGNIVEYYQQVGRAGRGISHAVGVLMLGDEDATIQQYFINNAFPAEKDINQLLQILNDADGLKLTDIEKQVNFNRGKITSILRFLSVEHPSPILKSGTSYYRTQFDYELPHEKIAHLTKVKHQEWQTLQDYHRTDRCLMRYLAEELDDDYAQSCGRCVNCAPANKISGTVDRDLELAANKYLRRRYITIKPRSNFATSGANARAVFQHDRLPYRDDALKCEEGKALSAWKDGGWGNLVADGKAAGQFSDDLLEPMVTMISSLSYTARPTWVAYIPSPRHPSLVRDFAHKLAARLNVPCVDCISIREQRPQQKTMQNSYYQSKNLDGAFLVDKSKIKANPVWLIDDAVDSGWTFTIAGALLRRAGAQAVYPMALTSTAQNGND